MLTVKSVSGKMVASALIFVGVLSGGQAVLSDFATASQRLANSTSNLTLSYHPSAGSQVTFKVSCLTHSISGTHPNKRAICAAIAKQGTHLFAPVPSGIACSEIYAGPESARITGTVKGVKINSVFNRTDGCQAARWNKARAFFTFPGYATAKGRIELSPTCAGAVKPGQNCTNESAAGVVTFTSNVQKSVRATAVAVDGFSVLLRRGTWTFTASDTGAMRCTPRILTVPTPGEVVLSCDTGMR